MKEMAISSFKRVGEGLKGFLLLCMNQLRLQFLTRQCLGADYLELRDGFANSGLRRAIVGGIGLACLNCVEFFVFLPHLGKPGYPSPYYPRLVVLYGMNMAAMAVFIPAAAFALSRNVPRIRYALLLFFIAYLHWVGLIFTVNGAGVHDQLFNYTMALIVTGTVFCIPALPSFAICWGFCALLCWWLGWFQSQEFLLRAMRVNAVFTCFFGYLISRISYHHWVNSFLKERTIQRQALELEIERGERRLRDFCILYGLTKRELEIIRLVEAGMPNQGIAEKVFVSYDTVKKHLYHIFQKTGVSNRFELARFLETGVAPRKPKKNQTRTDG